MVTRPTVLGSYWPNPETPSLSSLQTSRLRRSTTTWKLRDPNHPPFGELIVSCIYMCIFDLMCYCLGFIFFVRALFGYCAAEKFHYVALWHFGSVHLCQIQCLFTLKRFSAWEWGDESKSGCRCLSRGIFPGGKAHSRLDSDAESPFKCDDEQFKDLHRDTHITISICFGSGWKVGIFGKAALLTVSLDIWRLKF